VPPTALRTASRPAGERTERPPRRPSTALFAFDRRTGATVVAGADEAGRGSLAGPLVAAAVVLDLRSIGRRARRDLAELDDSKRLTPQAREALAAAILVHARQVTVLAASAGTVDRDGLHRTNLRLLGRVLHALDPMPDLCLVDGFRLGDAPPHRAIVDGDATSAAVAAASVIAKTTRDRLMAGPVADAYPAFGFQHHVGYATPEHHRALRDEGLCPLHRRSFRSVAYPELRLFEP